MKYRFCLSENAELKSFQNVEKSIKAEMVMKKATPNPALSASGIWNRRTGSSAYHAIMSFTRAAYRRGFMERRVKEDQ